MTNLLQRFANHLVPLTLAIAALYILTAKLGFMLAIEPGNVTAIWPPSGIALAAAIVFGWRAAAGIWLGSFIVNEWTISGELSLQISISIATGSLLQAFVSAKLLSLRQDQQQFYLPSTPPRILGFIAITALTTSIASTIGVISLWAGNQLGDVPFNLWKEPFNSLWWTWWIGDYAGILIGAPICLKIIASRFDQTGKDGWLLPISSAIMGGTLINFFFILQGYISDYQRQLDQDARVLKVHIEDRLNKQLYRLTTINAFFTASEKVEADEFSVYARQLIQEHSLTRMLEWVPAISAGQRQRFETEIRQSSQNSFEIYEKDTAGNRIPAGERDWYYPVLYIEPLAGNETARGFDLGSEIIRLNALQTARDSGKPTATGKLQLVQHQDKKTTILLANPLYANNRVPATVEERREQLLGFNVALIPIKKLIPEAIQMAGLDTMFVEIHDVTKSDSPRLIDSNFDFATEEKNNNIAPFNSRFTISFANRLWEFTVRLPRNNLSKLHPASVWLVLLAGLATTLIVVTYAHGRHQRETLLLNNELETRQLIEANPDGIVVIDTHGLIVRSNRQIQTLFGYSAIDLLGQPFNLLLAGDNSAEQRQWIENFIRDPQLQADDKLLDIYAVQRDGVILPVNLKLSAVNIRGSLQSMAIIRDIREQKAQQQAIETLNNTLEQRVTERTAELRQSRDEQRVLIDKLQYRSRIDARLTKLLKELQSTDDIDSALQLLQPGFRDLMPDTRGALLVETSPGQWHSIVQWSQDNSTVYPDHIHFEQCKCQQLQQPSLHKSGEIDNCTVSNLIQQLSSGEAVDAGYFCMPETTAGGSRAVLHIAGTRHLDDTTLAARRERALDIVNQIWLVMGNMQLRDILKAQAMRDGLTGLYNRRFFNDILEKEIARSLRSGTPLALAILDIDYFKKINDQYGHAYGDEVLKNIGLILQEHIRNSDYACRFGGEEFVLVMPDCLPEQATARMESLREKIALQRLQISGRNIQITLSIGIAHCPHHANTALSLLECADQALYQAKQGGRNRVMVAGNDISNENNWDI